MRLRFLLPIGLIVAGLLVGCGDSAPTTTSTHAPPSDPASLTVTLDRDGDGPAAAETAELSCEVGGDNYSEAACRAAGDLEAGYADPIDPDVACTELYGGPDVATISGTISGESVDVVLTRENGCEIERFDRFAGLLMALFDRYVPGASIDTGIDEWVGKGA